MWRWLATLPILAACLLPGSCSQYACGTWDSYCDGTVLHYCKEDDSSQSMYPAHYWATTDCADHSQVCVRGYDARISTDVSFCADSAQPDTHCSDPHASSQCVDNTLVGCRAGYVTGKTVCGSKRCMVIDKTLGWKACRDPQDPCLGVTWGFACKGDKYYACSDWQQYGSGNCHGCTLGADGNPLDSVGAPCP